MSTRLRVISSTHLFTILALIMLLCARVPQLFAAEPLVLDQNCVINILNRTVQASADGGFSLPNVPSTMGQVRARATCIKDGITVSGQTDYFTVINNGTADVGEFLTGEENPIPNALAFTHTGNDPDAPGTSNVLLTNTGEIFNLLVEATYPDNSKVDITQGSSGINYTPSNPAIVSVNANGMLTALSSGVTLITARKDGVIAVMQAWAVTSDDQDNDGLPDDYEMANGLDPNDPIDALEDQDKDGLRALEEYAIGTDLNNPDTDSDGIADREETIAGDDGFITNPLLDDSDGDGIRDQLEITVGSDPTDPDSIDLAASLTGISVFPDNYNITVNSIEGETSIQLSVIGSLLDGFTIDLTSISKGTNYSPNDLSICGLGARSGQLFATDVGQCTVTVSNSAYSTNAVFNVSVFSPSALTNMDIGDTALNVDVKTDHAYIAAAGSGIKIIDISDRSNPTLVGQYDTPGTAQDIKVVDDIAYVADGSAGLLIIDVRSPSSPVILGQYDSDGTAYDVVIRQDRAYLADGSPGFKIIDISAPTTPQLLGALDTSGATIGVDVASDGSFAVVASRTSGIQTISLTDESKPTMLGILGGGNARDVKLVDEVALVADYSRGFTSVDLSNLRLPAITATIPRENGGLLNDIETYGRYAVGADVYFVNGVPITDIASPYVPLAQMILDFSQYDDNNGNGVAIDNEYIYMVAGTGFYIGQYRVSSDRDLDGLTDQEEMVLGTDEFNKDTDNDGLDDGYEVTNQLDPLDPNDAQSADTDGDNLYDLDEIKTHQTDPLSDDTDNDNINDYEEINTYSTDPLRNDTDVDGLTDYDELFTYFTDPLVDGDIDGDGMTDGYEVINELDPRSDDADLDLDGDGLSNIDEFTEGTRANISDTDEDLISDGDEVNTHGTDPLDKDTDGDGFSDGFEINNNLDPLDPHSSVGYSKLVLSDAPLGYWKLDESLETVAIDSSGNGYNGQYMNGVIQDSPAPFGFDGIAEFDGIDDYIEVPSDFPTLVDNFSFEVWARHDRDDGYRTMVGRDRADVTSSLHPSFLFQKSEGTDTCGGTVTSTNDHVILNTHEGNICSADPNIVQLGRWHHYVVTMEAGNIRFYRDGQLVNERNNLTGSLLPQIGPLLIGAGYYSRSITDYFDGALSNVAIYDKALSEEDVNTHYTIGKYSINSNEYERALVVNADAANVTALNAIGIQVSIISDEVYLLKGDLYSYPILFNKNSISAVPANLLESLANYFSNPRSIETVGKDAFIAYVVAYDNHAGGGPTASIKAENNIEMGTYIVYEPTFWPYPNGNFYPPNWVKDQTNNEYIYNDDYEGVLIPWGSGSFITLMTSYVANTQELNYYINYGRCRMIGMNYELPLTTSLSGGEVRAQATYTIPVTDLNIVVSDFLNQSQ